MFLPTSRRALDETAVEKIEPSTSAFLLLLGVQGTYPTLAHHNSFLAHDGEAEFAAIFDQPGLPKTRPSASPASPSPIPAKRRLAVPICS